MYWRFIGIKSSVCPLKELNNWCKY